MLTDSSSAFPTTPPGGKRETVVTNHRPQAPGPPGRVCQGRTGPPFPSAWRIWGVQGLPPAPLSPVIQAWQQILWQCAGQSPLFLTHEVCGWCHVLWGGCSWAPTLGTEGPNSGWGGSRGSG